MLFTGERTLEWKVVSPDDPSAAVHLHKHVHKNHRFVSGELLMVYRLHGNAFIARLKTPKKLLLSMHWRRSCPRGGEEPRRMS